MNYKTVITFFLCFTVCRQSFCEEDISNCMSPQHRDYRLFKCMQYRCTSGKADNVNGIGVKKVNPFITDGCTFPIQNDMVSGANLIPCCVAHDYAYWRGGTKTQKGEADKLLGTCFRKAIRDKIDGKLDKYAKKETEGKLTLHGRFQQAKFQTLDKGEWDAKVEKYVQKMMDAESITRFNKPLWGSSTWENDKGKQKTPFFDPRLDKDEKSEVKNATGKSGSGIEESLTCMARQQNLPEEELLKSTGPDEGRVMRWAAEQCHESENVDCKKVGYWWSFGAFGRAAEKVWKKSERYGLN